LKKILEGQIAGLDFTLCLEKETFALCLVPYIQISVNILTFPHRKKNSQSRPQIKVIYVFTLLSKVAAWSFVRHSQDFLSSEPKMALETLEAQRNSPDLLVIFPTFIASSAHALRFPESGSCFR
jgi:hypothetical protein